LRRSAEARAQQPREIRLWLEGHHLTAKGCERAHPISRVCADVEHKVAGSDEAAIQTPEAPLAQRDGVIDGQRSHEAHATVKAAHLTGSLATIEPAVTAVSPRSKDAIDSSLDRPAARATLRYLSATVGGLDVPRQALR